MSGPPIFQPVFVPIFWGSDLEKAVEDLSELLESQIEPETIPMLRQKMTDKTVGAVKHCLWFEVSPVHE